MILSACTQSRHSAVPSSTYTRSQGPSPHISNGSPGGTHSPSASPNYRAKLAARPLHLPVLRRGQACPTSRGVAIHAGGFDGFAQGLGPVHPLGGDGPGEAALISDTQHAGWPAFKTLWFSQPSYQGPFLVRIRRLDRAGPAGLLENPQLTSFYTPRGPTTNGIDGYREITGATWVETPGCIAWQVDGIGFSNVIVVRTACRPPTCTIRSAPAGTKARAPSTVPSTRATSTS